MTRLILLAILTLSACTTPETVLKNEKTGQVARCGGNVAPAGILYPFMVESDKNCVSDYMGQGFKHINKE